MIGTILLWLLVVFTVMWTGQWVVYRKQSRGHFWAIVEVVFLWALVAFFFVRPDVSRMHLLWATPAVFIAAFLLLGTFFRAARRQAREGG